MTRKEELLLYINTNINDTNMLRVNEMIEYLPSGDTLSIKDIGSKTFGFSKDKLIKVITENYTNELYGQISTTDLIVLYIINWCVIFR